jgi:hypothetical protein
MPHFMLKRLILSSFPTRVREADIADSAVFMLERVRPSVGGDPVDVPLPGFPPPFLRVLTRATHTFARPPQLDDLTRAELLSRLILNVRPCYVEPEKISMQNIPVCVVMVCSDSLAPNQRV